MDKSKSKGKSKAKSGLSNPVPEHNIKNLTETKLD